MKSKIILVAAALAVSACSQGEDASGLFGGGSGQVSGLDGGPIDQNSLAYFNQVIGDRVLFEVNQSTLTPEARGILDQQAAWLLQRPSLPIVIEGHADERGTRDYNIRLSARRAGAVRDYLVTKGIPDSRLSTIPYGKERPLAICSEESCWSQNRRAVTVVTGGVGA